MSICIFSHTSQPFFLFSVIRPQNLISPSDRWLVLLACRCHPGRGFAQEGDYDQVGQPEEEQGDERPVVEEGEHEREDGDAEEGGGQEGGQHREQDGGGGLDQGQAGRQVGEQRVEVEIVPGEGLRMTS